MNRVTEKSSKYNNLERMSTLELLTNINREDQTVALAVSNELPRIEAFVNSAFEKMKLGGRLFYLGAGTSGRLGIVDASECPPTFGVPHGLVVGLIAGGDAAIRKAVEFAEDDVEQGWKDLEEFNVNQNDCIVGIAASGTTPYVLGTIDEANKR
ncbi:MAG: N-acetylmuramic acid 6-phosphate etherase, partial [Crocinitomicaceae bacterium]